MILSLVTTAMLLPAIDGRQDARDEKW